MKKTLVIFSILFTIPVFFVSAYTSPGKPTGAVNDFAGIFTVEERGMLETRVAEYARPAGLEMAVVTVSSLGGDTIEGYAVKLFAEWGIGKKLSDNGVLLLIAPDEREVRIEVGYGLEPYLTDAESSSIIRTVILPAFKSGDYFSGVQSGIDAMETAVNADPSDVPGESLPVLPTINLENLAIIFFVLVAQILPLMMYSKSWWLGGVVGFILGLIIWSIYAGAILAVIGLIVDYLLSKKYGGKRPTGRGMGGMFFGGGLGGRGGGGFGGFGGGMSGGGGASGRW
jgi:uncharacterized protein